MTNHIQGGTTMMDYNEIRSTLVALLATLEAADARALDAADRQPDAVAQLGAQMGAYRGTVMGVAAEMAKVLASMPDSAVGLMLQANNLVHAARLSPDLASSPRMRTALRMVGEQLAGLIVPAYGEEMAS